jgi:hypothetical protein
MKIIRLFSLSTLILFVVLFLFLNTKDYKMVLRYGENIKSDTSKDVLFYQENLLIHSDEYLYIKKLNKEKRISNKDMETLFNKGVKTVKHNGFYYIRISSGFDNVMYYDLKLKCWIRSGWLKYLMIDTCFHKDTSIFNQDNLY